MASSANTPTTVIVPMKSPADKVWNALVNSTILFPKALPELYIDIQKIDDTKRKISYGPASKNIKVSEEKADIIDELSKTSAYTAYTVMDGDLLKYYKSFKAKILVVPQPGNATMMKWIPDCVPLEHVVIDPKFEDVITKTFNDLDNYLGGSS